MKPIRTIRTFPNWPKGRVITLEHDSKVLRDNPWGDPHRRLVHVYVPPGYDEEPDRRYPAFWDLVGYTGSGASHIAWRNFQENVPDKVDRLIHEGQMGPIIVVFPDCFTSLGGNQYINSSAIGPYADYLLEELIPFVDGQVRTLADRKHRGVFGKSSGGYGAIIHGIRYADYWGGIADHSGDAYFDFVYRSAFPSDATVLAKHDRDVGKFLKYFWEQKKPTSKEVHTLMNICMAASYDPDPEAELGFHMPFDLYTGEVDESRWARWLEHDPVRLGDQYADNLRRLEAIYIDCGFKDQYHIHYGCRMLSEQMKALGIEHFYEEFDDDHSSVDYRMDVSFPYLYERLKP